MHRDFYAPRLLGDRGKKNFFQKKFFFPEKKFFFTKTSFFPKKVFFSKKHFFLQKKRFSSQKIFFFFQMTVFFQIKTILKHNLKHKVNRSQTRCFDKAQYWRNCHFLAKLTSEWKFLGWALI